MHDVERGAAGVALAMRVVERLADLGDDGARLRNRHRLAALAEALEQLPQVATRDVFHRDEEVVVLLSQLEDLDHIRVRELHGNARLVDEHGLEFLVLAHGGKDFLDREQPLEALDAERLGDEHLGHPADGDALEEQVFSKFDRLSHRARLSSQF